MLMNAVQKNRIFNLCLYGQSGTGKTTIGVSAPKSVYLLSESQGYESVVTAAAMFDVPVPPTFLIRNRNELREALGILRSVEKDPIAELCRKFGSADAIKTMPYLTPESVVLDSTTDMMKVIWDGILEESPPKLAKDNLPDIGMRHWQVMEDRAATLIRICRDLPYHMIYLCGLDDRETGEGEEKSRVVAPSMPMRKLPAVLAHACNGVGITRVKRVIEKGKEMGLEHWVQFGAPDFALVKPIRPLHDHEVPNISDWITRLREGRDSRAFDEEKKTPAADAAAPSDEKKPKPRRTKKDSEAPADAQEGGATNG